MPDIEHDNYRSSNSFLPFQKQFLDEFLDKSSPNIVELVSPPGTGKTHIAIEIIKRLEKDSSIRRVLMLAHNKVLLNHWKYTLEKCLSKLLPIIVDRRAYMVMESESQGEIQWPLDSIILMSTHVAEKKEIAESLAVNKWGLIVFEEGQDLQSKSDLFSNLSRSDVSKRVLLLSNDPLPSKRPGVQQKVIRLQDIIDWQGEEIFIKHKRVVENIEYEMSAEEMSICNEIKLYIEKLRAIEKSNSILSKITSNAAFSSYFALEETLRRMRDRWRPVRNLIAHELQANLLASEEHSIVRELQMDNLDLLGKNIAEDYSSPLFLELFDQNSKLIDDLEDLGSDRKLESLFDYLEKDVFKKGDKYICIWTSYLATAHYLQASLEGVMQPVYLYSSSLGPDERGMCINDYRASGGLLILTDVAGEGVDLRYVEQCINYDLPMSENSMEMRWGRFDRLGREKPFRMVAFTDQCGLLGFGEEYNI